MENFDYSKVLTTFQQDGYAIIPDFLTNEEINSLRQSISNIVNQFDPNKTPKSLFDTTDHPNARDDYFIDSSDKVSFFYETKAVDEKKNLIVDKKVALNKIGHALHVLDPAFKKVSFSKKIQAIVRAMKFEDPAIVQSMYIFKQPKIGGAVDSHIDASFLYCEPIDNLIGFWFALEDATPENGCLSFVPGSHKRTSLDYRFVRSVNNGKVQMIFRGDKPNYELNEFIETPVKAGSLVIIHGLVVHRSEENTSSKSRHAYTFHVMERRGSTWSHENWLQLPKGDEFASMYSTI